MPPAAAAGAVEQQCRTVTVEADDIALNADHAVRGRDHGRRIETNPAAGIARNQIAGDVPPGR
jgi:hypothetical protein